jgi:hypothetical protein
MAREAGHRTGDLQHHPEQDAADAKTNRIIQGRAPLLFLPALARNAGAPREAIQAHVATHAADPAFMLKDDFDDFTADRAHLLKLTGEAMGRRIEERLGDDTVRPDEDLDNK